jgi:hypothetical protein
MMTPAATVHTSLPCRSSYFFNQINRLTENIFPVNSSVCNNESRKFFPYNKIWDTTEYKLCGFCSQFSICVFINFYQKRLANFYCSVIIVTTNYLLRHLYLSVPAGYLLRLFQCLDRPFWARAILTIDASRSYSGTPHTILLLWTSDQPDTENSTWQYTTLTTDRHPCPRRDSNPKSQQTNIRRPRS